MTVGRAVCLGGSVLDKRKRAFSTPTCTSAGHSTARLGLGPEPVLEFHPSYHAGGAVTSAGLAVSLRLKLSIKRKRNSGSSVRGPGPELCGRTIFDNYLTTFHCWTII